MKIEHLILGAYQTNCYILRRDSAAVDCLIIDPGLEPESLIEFLDEHKLNPVAVVLTHGHVDHTAGVALLRGHFPGIKVYIHKLDAEMLDNIQNQPFVFEQLLAEQQGGLSAFKDVLSSTGPADIFVEDGDVIEQAGIKLEVLHVPGHTPGGICLYSKDHQIVFTNDTLFAESIGRTDLPDGSMEKLLKNISEKLLTLPDKTKVFSGHGPITTIAQQKSNNPFLK